MVFTTTFAKTSNIEAANKELISQVINYLSELAGETPDLESDVLYTGLNNLYPHLLIDYVSISKGISGNTVYTFSFKIISYKHIITSFYFSFLTFITFNCPELLSVCGCCKIMIINWTRKAKTGNNNSTIIYSADLRNDCRVIVYSDLLFK